MPQIESFPQIARNDARVLILGSMPSTASLAAGQYYGHPQNAFWRIMGELFGADRQLPYAKRQRILKNCGVAIWDVLQQCVREGSLDSSIDVASEVHNDFASFFAKHRQIRAIYFNGQKAHAAFRKHVLRELPESLQDIELTCLPSTSPAHAAKSFEEKLVAWKCVAERLAAR